MYLIYPQRVLSSQVIWWQKASCMIFRCRMSEEWLVCVRNKTKREDNITVRVHLSCISSLARINIKHLAVWGEIGPLNRKISFEKFFWPRFVNRTFIYTIQGAGTPYILLNVAQFEDAAISVSTEWLCTCMISEAMIYCFDLYTFISVILNCFVVLCVVLELEWTRRHIFNSCTYPNLCI